jgi:hypothetical protein
VEFRCDGRGYANRTYSFGRINGSVISERLRLAENGTIAGHSHPNESAWRVNDGNLEFLNDSGAPTTIFDIVEPRQDGNVLIGRFQGVYLHTLTQDVAVHPDLRFRRAQEIIGSIAGARDGKYLAVFLVHHAAAWDSVSGVYEAMTTSRDFLPLAVSIPHRFGKIEYDGEDEVSRTLSKLGVPHVRFDFADHRDGLALLKSLAPDILFRQAPWDVDIPEDYSLANLSFTRLVYTDYGLGICDGWGDYDTPFHNKAWLLTCANDDHRRQYAEHTHHNGLRAFVTGFPKFDKLLERGRAMSVWPLGGERRRYRIIWAPHHSVGPIGLAFGTFPWVCADILAWAARDEKIEVVFKPHPMLIETNGGVGKELFDAFMASWNALGNTSVQTGGDYAPLMSASDAMLTDGVSFLAEYPLFDKPLVWLDSGRHAKLNPMGERAVEANYKVQTVAQAIAIFQRLRDRGDDPMKQRREAVRQYLMPFPGEAAKRVLQCVRERFHEEANSSGDQ